MRSQLSARVESGRSFVVLGIAAALLLTAAVPSFAGPKEEMHAEMLAIASQMEALKASAEADAAFQYAGFERRYRELSGMLGGDDPAHLGIVGIATHRTYPTKGDVGGGLPAGCAGTTTSGTNSTPTAITDNASFTSTVAIAGAGPYTWDVTLDVAITHTFPGDLDITLMSPAGTVVTITTDNGGGSDDVFNGTTFVDNAGATNAPGPVTDATYSTGVTNTPLVIEEALAAFRGEDPNGTWTLEVGDDAGGDTGSLDSWTVNVTTFPAAPTDDAPVSGTNGTPVAITDNASFTDTVAIAGGGGTICSVELETFITHTFPGDLDITLTSPSGTVATITTDNGGGSDDVFNGTQWIDTSGDPATDHTYSTGVLASPLTIEEALAAFAGEDPNGTWTIEVGDDAGGDTGSLDEWTVTVTTCSCGPGGGGGPVFDVAVPTANAWALSLLALLLAGAGLLAFRRLS